MSPVRKPRFHRSAEISHLQLTLRDREIVRCVSRHRFLRSSHVVALIDGSKQAILRRLHLLYHHGYLERPRAQIEYYQQGGSRALVYGLANRGAELLNSTGNGSQHVLDWGEKNGAVRRLFLEHTLLVSDVMVALELACRRNGRVRFLTAEELPLPEDTRRLRQPFRWHATAKGNPKLGVIPDRVFGLEFLDQPADRNRAYFFLEADRATMPVMRENLRQSSFYRKLLAYEATWTQNIHRSRFGFHRFRVLTVTTSPDRVKHLVETCHHLERGQGLFLFTDLNTLLTSPDPLALLWQTGRAGATVRLIDG